MCCRLIPHENSINDARIFAKRKLSSDMITAPRLQRHRDRFFYATLLLCFATLTGCSTLASIGLPVGSSANHIISSAKRISDAPGRALPMPSELTKQPLDVYMVEIGDTLFVEPVSFDATIRLPGDQVVKPDGRIALGEFGLIEAANKTVDQIQSDIQALIDERIRQELEFEFQEELRIEQASASESDRPEFETADGDRTDEDELRAQERRAAFEVRLAERLRQNRVSVRLVNWDSKKIYVLGEVNSPGFFGYVGNETVLDAIIEAGGLTAKANHHQIIVARPTPSGSCRIVMKVCYDQIVQLGDTSTNYQLFPGDRVFVPSETFLDDVKSTFSMKKNDSCPRCAPCQQGCQLQ